MVPDRPKTACFRWLKRMPSSSPTCSAGNPSAAARPGPFTPQTPRPQARTAPSGTAAGTARHRRARCSHGRARRPPCRRPAMWPGRCPTTSNSIGRHFSEIPKHLLGHFSEFQRCPRRHFSKFHAYIHPCGKHIPPCPAHGRRTVYPLYRAPSLRLKSPLAANTCALPS